MNTAHGPILVDKEVKAVELITYSEQRFADIHGTDCGVPYEGKYFVFVRGSSCLLERTCGYIPLRHIC